MSNRIARTTAGDPSFQRLLTCLEQIRHKLDSHEDDSSFAFLCNYFQSHEFQKLFKVHKSVTSKDEPRSEPVSESATQLADEVAEVILPQAGLQSEVQELQLILRKPHVKGLLKAHDYIASNDFTAKNGEHSLNDEFFDELHEKSNEVSVNGLNKSVYLERHGNESPTVPVIEIRENIFNGPAIAAVVKSLNTETAWGDWKQLQPIPPLEAESLVLQLTDNVEESGEEGCRASAEQEAMLKPVVATENIVKQAVDVQMLASTPDDGFCAMGTSENFLDRLMPVHKNTTIVHSANKRKELGEEIVGEVYESNSKKATKLTTVVANGKSSEQIMDMTSQDGWRVVRILRDSKETLGVTVKVDESTESIIVARILSGGLADKSGSLSVGDEIFDINGNSVQGMTANEVASLMDDIKGSVQFKIVPAKGEKKPSHSTKISVRAFFDYDPMSDPLIPCKEVGVAFKKGDVLHLLNMDDPNWWQAREESASNEKTGIIPSKDFQEKRQLLNRITASESKQDKSDGRHTSPFSRWKRRKADSSRILCNFEQEVNKEQVPVYEPVAKYVDSSEKKRLLLLVGPPGVGRNELKKVLLSSNPDKFTSTVPHTSRPIRPYETDGRDYFFVSRQTMENFIQNRKFIEFGEYKGHLYGTSKDSIRRAIKMGKTCVLKVQPEVTLLLRTADYKPFCIFVKPPTLGELRSSRLTMTSRSSSQKSSMRTFKEEELQDMINASKVLETNFGHLFDLTVINKDLEQAHAEILDAVERLQQETQWVPLSWVQDK